MTTTADQSTGGYINVEPAPTNTVAAGVPSNFQPAPTYTAAAAANQPFNSRPAPVETVVADTTASSKLIENAAVDDVVTDLKKLEADKEKLEADTKKLVGAFTAVTLVACLCGSCMALTALGIASIIPLLQLIIGLKYEDDCPAERHIPHYLVVAGAVGLSAIGLSLLQLSLGCFNVFKPGADSALAKYGYRGISIILFLLNIFSVCWFIAGCVWVFRVWNEVQYERPGQTNYCKSTLYRFAFWLLLLSIIYHLITCCQSCRQLTGKKDKKKKGAATTEP